MRLPIPFAEYGSSRVDASEQRTVNMYPHSGKGWRQFPGLTGFSSVPPLSDPSDSVDVSAQNVDPYSVWMKPNGLSMYVMDNYSIDPQIEQWTLSVANDVSSATYTAAKSLPRSQFARKIIAISPDGENIIWTANDNPNFFVYRWQMSTPWDITTATATSSFDFGLAGGGERLVGALNSDGTRAFLGPGRIGFLTLTEYTMTAYDVTTLSVVSANTNTTLSGTGVAMTADLKTIYTAAGAGGSNVKTYNLVTAGDLTSISPAVGNFATPTGVEDVALFNSEAGLVFAANINNTAFALDIISSPASRGAINMAGVLYSVIGSLLYSVSSQGVAVEIGAIDGTERIVMETDGVQLVITTGADGGKIYRYTVAGGLTTVTDSNIGGGRGNLLPT